MSRETVVNYFKSLLQGKLERTPSLAWDSLVCAAADIPAPELIEDVRWAYTQGLARESFARLESLEQDLLGKPRRPREPYTLITDTVDEMEWWASFHREEELSDEPEPEPTPVPATVAASPSRTLSPSRPLRQAKVGRNDPCPCGSGKKYKKCCAS